MARDLVFIIGGKRYIYDDFKQWLSRWTKKTKTGKVYYASIQLKGEFIKTLGWDKDLMKKQKFGKGNFGSINTRDINDYEDKINELERYCVHYCKLMLQNKHSDGRSDALLFKRKISANDLYADDE